MRVLFVKQELSQVHIVTPVPGVTGTETYHPRYWCISGMQDQLCTGMLDMVNRFNFRPYIELTVMAGLRMPDASTEWSGRV